MALAGKRPLPGIGGTEQEAIPISGFPSNSPELQALVGAWAGLPPMREG